MFTYKYKTFERRVNVGWRNFNKMLSLLSEEFLKIHKIHCNSELQQAGKFLFCQIPLLMICSGFTDTAVLPSQQEEGKLFAKVERLIVTSAWKELLLTLPCSKALSIVFPLRELCQDIPSTLTTGQGDQRNLTHRHSVH